MAAAKTTPQMAAAIIRELVGGAGGRPISDPVVRAVTEGRIAEGYSSCADLPHAFRFIMGLRDRVNRKEAGGYQCGARTMAWLCEPGRVGSKVGHPCATVPRPGTKFSAGDTIILDVAHPERTHTCLVLSQRPDAIDSGDYGQHPMHHQAPSQIACREVARPLRNIGDRLWIGDRPIDSWLPLQAELDWARATGTLKDPWTLDSWLRRNGVKDAKPGWLPTLRRGSGAHGGAEAEAVKLLQSKLTGLTIDGRFGPFTEDAVKSFQLSEDLTVDGVVGPKTWGRLGY